MVGPCPHGVENPQRPSQVIMGFQLAEEFPIELPEVEAHHQTDGLRGPIHSRVTPGYQYPLPVLIQHQGESLTGETHGFPKTTKEGKSFVKKNSRCLCLEWLD